MSEEIISTVNAGQESVVETQQTESVESVSSESVEVAAPQTENKPTQSAEENARYAQIRREAESKARDKTIADMGMEWNGQKITTYDQYMKAKAESEQYEREQKIRAEYEAKGVPDELLDELIESKRDREERQKEKQAKAEDERKNAEYKEFFEYFKQENGRDFNSATDVIPQEVWEQTTKGKTLTDAYAYHANKQLKAKITELESKLQAQETNKNNAASSPGSVTGNGNGGNDFISFENYETNKHDQSWVNKNFKKIMDSRSKW